MLISESNLIKYKSGKSSKDLLGNVLFDLHINHPDFIIVKSDYSVGYPNKLKQFKMDYQIIFPKFNNETWLIKSTSSIRERIYGVEFFSQNIRNIDKNVTKIFVVVPDSISDKEKKNVTNYSKKIKNPNYTSFLDDVLLISDMRALLLKYIHRNTPQGIKSNIFGKDSEKQIVNLLNDTNNQKLWNDYFNNQPTIKSFTFEIYKKILETIGLTFNKDKIIKISATSNIPKLNINGKKIGNPKTDVSFAVESTKGNFTHNISIKNTSKKYVTIHEGSVTDLITALNIPNDSQLAKALQQFELYGSEKYLKKNQPELFQILNKQLSIYNVALTNFFVFGGNSPLISQKNQVADMILYTNKFEVWTKDKYIKNYIPKYSNQGQFGTPFKWTYPSKKKGYKIQIKAFTNNY